MKKSTEAEKKRRQFNEPSKENKKPRDNDDTRNESSAGQQHLNQFIGQSSSRIPFNDISNQFAGQSTSTSILVNIANSQIRSTAGLLFEVPVTYSSSTPIGHRGHGSIYNFDNQNQGGGLLYEVPLTICTSTNMIAGRRGDVPITNFINRNEGIHNNANNLHEVPVSICPSLINLPANRSSSRINVQQSPIIMTPYHSVVIPGSGTSKSTIPFINDVHKKSHTIIQETPTSIGTSIGVSTSADYMIGDATNNSQSHISKRSLIYETPNEGNISSLCTLSNKRFSKSTYHRGSSSATKGKQKLNTTSKVARQVNVRDIPSFNLDLDEDNITHDHKDGSLGISKDYFDIGDLDYECKACKALLWYHEAVRGNKDMTKKKYSLCCMNGKVQLPGILSPPELLVDLYSNNDARGRHFIKNIRQYNNMFNFTSMGGKVDNRYNQGRGPYCFRMHGENYHTIGDLLPEEGGIPKFAQLYIYDTDHELSNRFTAYSSGHGNVNADSNSIDFVIADELKALLDRENPLVKSFRMVRDRLSSKQNENVYLKLIGRRDKDGRTYNLPSTNEVAALIVGDIDGCGDNRDIVLETNSGKLKRINELHPSYLALQYPLIFPYAEDGYRVDIPLRDVEDKDAPGRTRLSMRAFFAYRIQQRLDEVSLMLKARKLFQQFLVDAFTMVENERLYYIKSHQQNLRVSSVKSLNSALGDGQSDSSLIGNRVILPSSFTGGQRYMQQCYMDAMTLCRFYGYPDLFLTITCNPKWLEVCRIMKDLSLNPEDKPDLLSRVFKIKLDNLINDIKERNFLGRVNAVEYQKRGLPHAHMCLFFRKEDKLPNPVDIDRVISAEIPLKEDDPELYQLVSDLMIHGPCGNDNPKCPCTINYKCTKNFPKDFNDSTIIDGSGYPLYRRRDTGVTVEKTGVKLDNRYVVPYNAMLLKRYQCHINVEWCNQMGSIKYLFKYISKGPDRITVALCSSEKQASESNKDDNEVKNYFDCRYVSACEASWRLFAYDIRFQTPHVERLSFHLKGEEPILYPGDKRVKDILSKPSVGSTQFTDWMRCNKEYPEARNLTYVEFPQHFVWNPKSRKWTPRQRGMSLGRINYVPPKVGEAYYLRILLGKVKGPTSHEEIKKVNDFEHNSYKDACYALGLLEDDKEYIESIKETSGWASASYCRSLFVMLIASDSLSRAEYVWDQTWQYLSDDILHLRRQELGLPDLTLNETAIKNIALAKIEMLLKEQAMSLKQIPNMPYPDFNYIDESCNMLIQEELSYDKNALKVEHDQLYSMMTAEQKNIYHKVTDAVLKGKGGVFFVYGYGGTGKTFLWKTLSAGIRSKGLIVLNVASSGIAALLLAGGRTAHSRFAIPINLHEDSFCSVNSDSQLAELLRKTDLIIWDEAPMMHRHCFEALDRTLKDKVHPQNREKPFGGKVIVFGGDFRQILPVIQKGRREDIVNASINSSFLWKYCSVFRLTVNMRLKSGSSREEILETKEFADWILDIGEGKVGGPNHGESEIDIPDDLLIKSNGDHVHSITSTLYPNINEHMHRHNFFEDRAILVPTNEEVDFINDYMLSKVNGEEKTYYSADNICPEEENDTFEESLYAPEILNSFKVSGLPNHKLTLKKDVPIMLLRNLNQSKGLCNGTRLQVNRLGEHTIEARVISGNNVGYITHIPRLKLIPSDTNIPFKFQRRQFPVLVCFAMTINKSQGQSLSNVGLFLRKPLFTHGQLYVAVSRVKTKKGLKILILDNNGNPTSKTMNVVYKEVLQKI